MGNEETEKRGESNEKTYMENKGEEGKENIRTRARNEEKRKKQNEKEE